MAPISFPRLAILAALTILSNACVPGNIILPEAAGSSDDSDGGVGQADGGAVGDPDAEAPAPRVVAATGIQIAKISVYQAVEVPVFVDGAEVQSRNAPIVGGADAMVGVFIELEPNWTQREVVGVLTIETAGVSQDFAQTVSFATDTGNDPSSGGFSILVPGDSLTTTTEFAFSIIEVDPDATPPEGTPSARIPADGAFAMQVLDPQGTLNLTLVPFQYNADGSGRLPPTDAAAQAVYVQRFSDMFPISGVTLTVRAPVPYENALGPSNNNSWGLFLDRLQETRAQDNPPANTYYYGIMAPTQTFGQFCSQSCISGLGNVPSQNSVSRRAAVGVSFSGSLNIGTALHEIGHTMGRSHAPCGSAGNPDPAYPYAGGLTGGIGYSRTTQSFFGANSSDFMGYCGDEWISDYSFSAIFDRIAYVNGSGSTAFAVAPEDAMRYRVGLVNDKGEITWTRYLEDGSTQDIAEAVDVELIHPGGLSEQVVGFYAKYDHLEGGTLLVPEPDFTPVRVEVKSLASDRW